MIFHYVAAGPDQKLIEEDMDAKDIHEVLTFLSIKGFKPVSVKPLEGAGQKQMMLFGRGVTITDQIFLSKYLALMLKIGTGLLEAINVLIADFTKPSVKDVLVSIRTSLEQGKPFYTTFARYPKVFSSVYVNLVRAGEASGNLESTFDQLTQILTKQKDLRDQIKSALAYPLLLLCGSVLILFFIVMFALPKIAKVFSEGGFEPPLFSRVVFSVGLFVNSYGFYLLGFVIAAAIFFFIFSNRSPVVKRFLLNLVKGVPLLKDIVKKMALQRFASILGSLIKAGMPISEAIEITATTVGNPELEESLIRVSAEGIAKGLTIGDAFRREAYFPLTVVSLVAISEKAGHLGDVLETLSDFYVKEIDASLKTLVSFLEPVLLLGIGSVIGVIALAIIIPIYQLTTQF